MNKNRLEAFSDGVIAIIITIMVLELKVPHGVELADLKGLIPTAFCYLLSFIYVGIYWNNHHHLFHAAHHVDGYILWANLHLLFWLSLIPFATGWMGENHSAATPIALYGTILFMAAIAYYLLVKALIRHHGKQSTIAMAIGSDFKGTISVVLYAIGIGAAFFAPVFSVFIYVLVAALWFIPDRRIEKNVHE